MGLGRVLHQKGELQEAEELLREALDGYIAVNDNFRIGQARRFLVELLRSTGREEDLEEAQRLGAQALRDARYSAGSMLRLRTMHARTLVQAGDLAGAKQQLDLGVGSRAAAADTPDRPGVSDFVEAPRRGLRALLRGPLRTRARWCSRGGARDVASPVWRAAPAAPRGRFRPPRRALPGNSGRTCVNSCATWSTRLRQPMRAGWGDQRRRRLACPRHDSPWMSHSCAAAFVMTATIGASCAGCRHASRPRPTYSTIQEAIDAAVDGDVVLVADGTVHRRRQP